MNEFRSALNVNHHHHHRDAARRDEGGREYWRRVRGTVFIWGSAGVTHNLSFSHPLILHVQNDLFGESVSIGTQKANGTKDNLGTLQAGECLSIPINDICGVFATCALQSSVFCRFSGAARP